VLGRARTGFEGLAGLSAIAPNTPGDYLIEGRVVTPPFQAQPKQLLLSVRAPAERLVVIDLERTIADGTFFEIILRQPQDVQPVAGAPSAVTDIDADALVVYLVGHDFVFGPEVRAWLAHWGFPRGVTIFGSEFIYLFSRTSYKAAIYQVLGMSHNVAAGFGEDSDDEAAAAGVGASFFLIGTGTGSGAPTFPDWNVLRAANAAGQLPDLSWATRLN
jgi:hypothetical protein